MSSFDQIPYIDTTFADAEFAVNPEPRCPVVLLLDTSSSMRGDPIDELNAGLITFKDELMADSLAAKRVEIAIVTFGPVNVEQEFVSADAYRPPGLRAGADTPMGEAIVQALDMLRQRKKTYRANGVSYYRPWVFLITDGAPTDDWQTAAGAIREDEMSKACMFFAVGVEGANFEILREISVREPLRLKGLRFRDLFSWLSASLSNISQSSPGDAIALLNPATPAGWATTE